GPYYTVDYVFAVDGVEYAGQAQPDAESYAALQEGQPIRVQVWEAGPEGGHSWDGSEAGSLSTVGGLCFAALFWNGMISIIVWQFYLRPWRKRRLVRYGMPTAGVVREVKVSQEK